LATASPSSGVLRATLMVTVVGLVDALQAAAVLLGPARALPAREVHDDVPRDLVGALDADRALERLDHGDKYAGFDLAAFEVRELGLGHAGLLQKVVAAFWMSA
jgi:hypothetical protein